MADIERSWLTNPSRRTALARVAGLMAASPIAAAVAQTDPRPLSEHHRVLSLAEMQTAFDFEPVFFGNVLLPIYDYTAHGDGSEFTLRRNRQAYRLGRHRAGTRRRPGIAGRPLVRVAGREDEIPDHRRADSGDGAPASGWRDRDVQGGDRGLEHADDAERQHQHAACQGRTCRARRHAVGAVLPAGESGQHPAVDGHVPECRLQRHHRHHRSAGVLLRTHAAGPQFRRARCAVRAAAARVPAVELRRPPVRHGTGSAASACGTPGNISTTCGKWSKARC